MYIVLPVQTTAICDHREESVLDAITTGLVNGHVPRGIAPEL